MNLKTKCSVMEQVFASYKTAVMVDIEEGFSKCSMNVIPESICGECNKIYIYDALKSVDNFIPLVITGEFDFQTESMLVEFHATGKRLKCVEIESGIKLAAYMSSANGSSQFVDDAIAAVLVASKTLGLELIKN